MITKKKTTKKAAIKRAKTTKKTVSRKAPTHRDSDREFADFSNLRGC